MQLCGSPSTSRHCDRPLCSACSACQIAIDEAARVGGAWGQNTGTLGVDVHFGVRVREAGVALAIDCFNSLQYSVIVYNVWLRLRKHGTPATQHRQLSYMTVRKQRNWIQKFRPIAIATATRTASYKIGSNPARLPVESIGETRSIC